MQRTNRGLVFGILCLIFIFALFLRTCTAIIAEDLLRDFAIPATSFGLMASVFFYAYAAAQIPVGILADRIGVRYTVFGFGLLGVAASIFFAYAPNIQIATWARLLTGAGTAGIWIPTLKYLSTEYPPHKFATMTSIINATGSMGSLLSTLPMAILVERIGWRRSLIMPTLIMFVLLLIAWFLMKPQTKKTEKETEIRLGDQEIALKDQETAAASRHRTPFWRYPIFWPFAFWAFLVYGVLLSFSSLWGAAYLQDVYHISRKTAGSHLMFISIGMLAGGVLWGVLSDRIFQARRPIMFIATLGLLLTWLAMASFSVYPGPFYTSLIYFAIGIFSVVFLINLSCVKELFPAEIAATAMGTVNACMFIGVAFFQGITGYLLDITIKNQTFLAAFRLIFILYLISITLAFLLVFFMPETFPANKKPS
ncbi:MAG: MFS transporter [Dethiobacteria bacterium]|jgi:sugar phosphate permease